jgi:hypothetical protein
VPVEREQLAPGLIKLKPTRPLPPGEYALAELVEEKLNLDVWDFGIEGTRGAARAPEAEGPAPYSEHPPGEAPERPKAPRAPRPTQPLPPTGPPTNLLPSA